MEEGLSSSTQQLDANGTTDQLPRVAPSEEERDDQSKQRFQLELEFVQCLANPQYLQFLAQQQYFSDPAFLNYLAYLRYWQQPKYARYIIYPYCLQILELLQHASFRAACASPETTKFLHEKEYWHWQTYRRKRMLDEHLALDI